MTTEMRWQQSCSSMEPWVKWSSLYQEITPMFNGSDGSVLSTHRLHTRNILLYLCVWMWVWERSADSSGIFFLNDPDTREKIRARAWTEYFFSIRTLHGAEFTQNPQSSKLSEWTHVLFMSFKHQILIQIIILLFILFIPLSVTCHGITWLKKISLSLFVLVFFSPFCLLLEYLKDQNLDGNTAGHMLNFLWICWTFQNWIQWGLSSTWHYWMKLIKHAPAVCARARVYTFLCVPVGVTKVPSIDRKQISGPNFLSMQKHTIG